MVEGCDSNGCEYMTGGNIVILGDVGDNFGAGMTGGMAFIYDLNNEFEKRVNSETVIWQRLETSYWKNFLKTMVKEHFNETGSKISKKILDTFDDSLKNFYQVCPREMLDKLEYPISKDLKAKRVG